MSKSLSLSGGRRDAMPKVERPDDGYRGSARVGWAILLLFFGGFGTWAALAPLNAAVIGDGVVTVQGNRNSIQHTEGGKVRVLSVSEGSTVREGDVLVQFDDTQARAQFNILDKQQMQLLAVEARLLAEAERKNEISFPSKLLQREEEDFSSVLREQVEEFNVRRLALAGRIDVLEMRILQTRTQLSGSETQKVTLEEKLSNLTSERETMEGLVKRGLATKARLNELKRAESETRGELEAYQTSADVQLQSVAEVQAQIDELVTDRNSVIASELRETRQRLAEITPKLEAAQETLQNLEIRSPTNGRIVGLKFFNPGQVVRPGEYLFDIVPDSSPLNIEARIRVEDITDVHSGMDAEVQFTSYRQKMLPVIRGKVTGVSADRLTDERTNIPYFTVMVDVNVEDLVENPDIQLYPGMPANVIITTEQRSALDYLIGPLAVKLGRSFHER